MTPKLVINANRICLSSLLLAETYDQLWVTFTDECAFFTVSAIDYVGHRTSVTSKSVTIDTTPPEVCGSFISNERQIAISMEDLFKDYESGTSF